jgi:hypothetical protein
MFLFPHLNYYSIALLRSIFMTFSFVREQLALSKFDLCDIILYPAVSQLVDQTQECLCLVPAIQLPGCGTPVLQVELCARFMGMKEMLML